MIQRQYAAALVASATTVRFTYTVPSGRIAVPSNALTVATIVTAGAAGYQGAQIEVVTGHMLAVAEMYSGTVDARSAMGIGFGDGGPVLYPGAVVRGLTYVAAGTVSFYLAFGAVEVLDSR